MMNTTKKTISILLVLILAAGCLSACGTDSDTPAASSVPVASSAPAASAAPQQTDAGDAAPAASGAPAGNSGYAYKTDATNKTYNEGSFDKSLITVPVLITSFGQSADVSMLDALFKKLDTTVEYAYEPLAEASVIANYKTVIVAAGMSSKGLGAAGISEEAEIARSQEVMQAMADNGVTVIFAHLGGSARRGIKSDEFADIVMPLASYMLVVEEGNERDSKFSNFASSNGIPLTLVHTIADCLIPLNEIFS